MVTLTEAREHIGAGVVYRPLPNAPWSPTEDGTITSVNERWVFVRYAGDTNSKATDPAHLTFLAGDES
jgi:hypothetical protein